MGLILLAQAYYSTVLTKKCNPKSVIQFMSFKYKAKFDSVASFDSKKWKEAKARKEAFASLDDLRSLLPSDEEVKDNHDLLYVAFNVAVANLINANDQGIDTETALAISKYFVDRHMNIEHDRYDVVGHIISQGYSSFGENSILTPESLVGTTEPFNISLGAVVYKIVREYMANVIEESAQSKSEYSGSISASWEIGFNEFDIILGSKKIADAKRITDEEEILKLSPYLKMEGGSGFLPDGTPVYCLIKGDARPLGCAFTGSPAAEVSGVFVPSEEDDDDEKKERRSYSSKEDVPSVDEESLKKIREDLEQTIAEKVGEEFKKQEIASEKQKNDIKLKEINKKSSQNIKTTVNNNMKLKSTEDITPEFLQHAEASTEVRKFIVDKLAETSEAYVEKVKTLETAKKDADASLASTNEALANVRTELETLKKQVEAKARQEAFDARMEELSSVFELNATQSTAIASQIKDLDDTAFSSWKSNFDLFATKKSAKASTEKEEEKTEKTDKAEKEATAALKDATAADPALANAQSPGDGEDELSQIIGTLKKSISFKQ